MKLLAVTGDDVTRISLEQDSDDVNILVNGEVVAFFASNNTGTLTLVSNSDVDIPTDDEDYPLVERL